MRTNTTININCLQDVEDDPMKDVPITATFRSAFVHKIQFTVGGEHKVSVHVRKIFILLREKKKQSKMSP